MKVNILLILAALISASQAYSLMDGFKAAAAEAPRVRQENIDDAEKGYEGLDPLVGRNVASVLFTDVINLVAAPGAVSYTAFFFDLFNFFFMPMMGGLMMSSVTYHYENDYITYQNANIGKGSMYTSQMKGIKNTIYKLAGKPNFFDEADAAYQAP